LLVFYNSLKLKFYIQNQIILWVFIWVENVEQIPPSKEVSAGSGALTSPAFLAPPSKGELPFRLKRLLMFVDALVEVHSFYLGFNVEQIPPRKVELPFRLKRLLMCIIR